MIMAMSEFSMAATPGDGPTPPRIDWPAALAQHGAWLRTVLRARLDNTHDIDEAMQEVALAAVSGRAPIQDASKVAWLYRLTIRQELQFRRRYGRRRRLHAQYADQTAPTEIDNANPIHWLLSEERREMVRRALVQLGDRDREVLLLKYTQNWSYREIAEHLGVSPSTVESRLHRARGRLRGELAKLHVVEPKP